MVSKEITNTTKMMKGDVMDVREEVRGEKGLQGGADGDGSTRLECGHRNAQKLLCCKKP